MPTYTTINDLPEQHRAQAAAEIAKQGKRPSPGPGNRAVTVKEVDARPKRRHKYNAQAVEVDGIRFDSKLEAKRYQELQLLAAAGEIHALQLQPRFELQESFRDAHGKKHRAINYVADFQYVENGHVIVEEVKGHETAVWRLKKKLFLYRYGRQVVLRIIK